MVDALIDGGEEGRTRLRKAMGSCQGTLIHRYPNGATQLAVMSTTIHSMGQTW